MVFQKIKDMIADSILKGIEYSLRMVGFRKEDAKEAVPWFLFILIMFRMLPFKIIEWGIKSIWGRGK